MCAYRFFHRIAVTAGLVLLLVLIVGCRLDEERQLSIRTPVTLIIKNETVEVVNIHAIVNSPDAGNTFVLNSGEIASAGSLSYRVPAEVYTEILAGAFVLQGVCGGKKNWEVSGRKLKREEVHDVQRWDLIVLISACDP